MLIIIKCQCAHKTQTLNTYKQWWQQQRQMKNNFDRNEGIFLDDILWYFTIMYSTSCIWKREFLTFNTRRPPSLSYSISDPNSYLSLRKVARDHTLNNFHAPRPSPLPHRLLKCLLSFHFVWVPELLDKILKISCKI